jgi:hypothetical protein
VYLEEVSLESPVWQVNGDFGGLGPWRCPARLCRKRFGSWRQDYWGDNFSSTWLPGPGRCWNAWTCLPLTTALLSRKFPSIPSSHSDEDAMFRLLRVWEHEGFSGSFMKARVRSWVSGRGSQAPSEAYWIPSSGADCSNE